MEGWKEPKVKPGELKVQYGKVKASNSPDICYCRGEGTLRADVRLLDNVFSNLYDELEKRGYDLTTLKFSIYKK